MCGGEDVMNDCFILGSDLVSLMHMPIAVGYPGQISWGKQPQSVPFSTFLWFLPCSPYFQNQSLE